MRQQRVSEEVKELTGAFAHDPKRRKKRVPKIQQPLGEPPDYFNEAEKIVWAELQCNYPPEVLVKSDRHSTESYCKLFAKVRADTYTSAELTQFVRLLQMFGGTPADRVRLAGLAVDKPKSDSPYAEFS